MIMKSLKIVVIVETPCAKNVPEVTETGMVRPFAMTVNIKIKTKTDNLHHREMISMEEEMTTAEISMVEKAIKISMEETITEINMEEEMISMVTTTHQEMIIITEEIKGFMYHLNQIGEQT